MIAGVYWFPRRIQFQCALTDYVLPKGKTYITCDSHVVPHRSTEQAQGCLTSEFGWDPVLSPWYERMMGDHWTDPPPTGVPEPHKRPRTSEYTKARIPIHSHTFSAFWLRSSVVSVLISVKTDSDNNVIVFFHMDFCAL